MYTYADLQFFRINKDYVVKEFAALSSDNKLSHYIFKHPMEFTLLNKDDKRGVRWLERHHHKINWSTGHIPYKYVTAVITRDLKGMIYVKGHQKVQFLQSLGIYAENIEDMGIKFRIRDLKDGVTCKNHNNDNYICALLNVFKIRDIINFF